MISLMSAEPSTEAELVARARQGDAAAFAVLYDRHGATVWSLARRILGDESLADDAAQETWLAAVKALGSFRGDSAFSTWLHRIAVSACARIIRRDHTRRVVMDSLAHLQPAESEPESDPFLRARIEQAIDSLPDGMRRVLVLHDVEGMSHTDIAEALGIAPVTSRTQLARARMQLREMLRPTVRDEES